MLKEPVAGFRQDDGYSVPILYDMLKNSLSNMADALNKANFENESYLQAIRFLTYSKIAINTIPMHKVDKELQESVKKEWSSLFMLISTMSKAPTSQKILSMEEMLRLHGLYSDIIKCLDASGLGWGNFYVLTTKRENVKSYLNFGRN